jgi:GntR family transcriptional repressor for pyruvate dehydrogenase complex
LFDKIKNLRIFEQIASEVRRAILTGELRPGDKLPPESELAQEFGVGRPAIREALRTLEIAGLVSIHQGREGGAVVQSGDLNTMKDHFSDLLRLGKVSLSHLTEARSFMETMMFDIMPDKITAKHIDDLRASVERTREFFHLGQEEDRINENFNFHTLLAAITENPVIILNVSTIIDLMGYFLIAIRPTRQISQNTIDAHANMTELLARGDFKACKEVNRKHIADVAARLIGKCSQLSLGEYPDLLQPAIWRKPSS